jgi:hypothetical protein
MTSDLGPSGPSEPSVDFSLVAAAGFDAVSPYSVLPFLWPTTTYPIPAMQPMPLGIPYSYLFEQAVDLQTQTFLQSLATEVKYVTALTPDFDSRWIFWAPAFLYFSGQNHFDYWQMVSTVRSLAIGSPQALPVNTNTGKPVIGLGSWNEQGESSGVEPGWSVFQWPGGGNEDPFAIATTVAKLFGGPSTYDEYLPGDYGRGFPVKDEWTFSTTTGAGLDEWNTSASAGLTIGVDDVLNVVGMGRLVINTPTYLETAGLAHVKLKMRVDEGAAHLNWVHMHARSSDYSATAHQFGAALEPGRSVFHRNVYVESYTTTADGYREYTFPLAAHTTMDVLKYLEFRFDVPVGTTHAARYAIKRVWIE